MFTPIPMWELGKNFMAIVLILEWELKLGTETVNNRANIYLLNMIKVIQ